MNPTKDSTKEVQKKYKGSTKEVQRVGIKKDIDKDKERENIKEKAPKSPYGEFGHVHLTFEEYQKLQDRLNIQQI